MRDLPIVLIVVVGICAGCGRQSSSGPAAENGESVKTEAAAPVSMAGEGQMEIACAMCIYGMEGVNKCVLATKVVGKSVLVSGIDTDAHHLGLCSQSKVAVLKGELDGDTFVASSIQVQ